MSELLDQIRLDIGRLDPGERKSLADELLQTQHLESVLLERVEGPFDPWPEDWKEDAVRLGEQILKDRYGDA